MMDPEVGCEEKEEDLDDVEIERMMMRIAHPKLPSSVSAATRGFFDTYNTEDLTTARLHLRVIKDWLKGLKSLPPLLEDTPNCLGELNFAGHILRSAVLMTIYADEDPAAFDEEFDHLRPYYACIDLIQPSAEGMILAFGYYLMRLLEKNRIADFHAELKSLSATDRANHFIQHAVKAEKLLSRCPTLDCKFLRQIYRTKLCGGSIRNSLIPCYVQRLMFSRPRERILLCVDEVEELPRSEGKSNRSLRILPEKVELPVWMQKSEKQHFLSGPREKKVQKTKRPPLKEEEEEEEVLGEWKISSPCFPTGAGPSRGTWENVDFCKDCAPSSLVGNERYLNASVCGELV